MLKELVEYDIDGFNPFREWLGRQTKDNQDKIFARLDRIRHGNYGNISNEGNNIIAIRFIKEGLRICVSNIGNLVVIILNGDDKSSKA